MTTFLDDESSVESSQPREIYEIKQNLLVTYYVASGTQDIDYGGHTYVASPVARTDVLVSTTAQQSDLTLALPLNHPLVQRYLAQGSPPGQILVTIRRLQLVSSVVEQIVNGVITTLGMDGHIAKFTVVSRLARAIGRKLPTLSTSRKCRHFLFDTNCKAVRSTFQIGDDGTDLHVVSVNGRDVVLETIGGQPDHWAQFGELTHVATGERMMVLDQVGTSITMQAPLPELKTGEIVYLSAGCAKDIFTCGDKFFNFVNFAGFPKMPSENPFVPTGAGVMGNS